MFKRKSKRKEMANFFRDYSEKFDKLLYSYDGPEDSYYLKQDIKEIIKFRDMASKAHKVLRIPVIGDIALAHDNFRNSLLGPYMIKAIRVESAMIHYTI